MAPSSARVRIAASSVRYMLTPSQDTKAGRAASTPAAASPSARVWVWKSTGAKARLAGGSTPAAVRRCSFQAWVDGWSISNT